MRFATSASWQEMPQHPVMLSSRADPRPSHQLGRKLLERKDCNFLRNVFILLGEKNPLGITAGSYPLVGDHQECDTRNFLC